MSNNEFDKGWIKVNGFLNKDMADYLYGYVLLSKRRLEVLESEIDMSKIYQTPFDKEHLWGTFNDIKGCYARGGDLVFETLLLGKLKQLEKITNSKLSPQYSFYRLYMNGSELVRHKDRKSCEISATLCLGYDSHYNWPIWFENSDGKEISVELQPGDGVIYKGCDLDHWREPFKGNNHAQVFLHYTNLNGPYGHIKFDGKGALGGWKVKK